MLNGGIFLLSILFFDYLLLPTLKYVITYFVGSSSVWHYVQFTLSRTFDVMWVLPLFVLSKIINTIFFQDIADAAYEFRKGRPTLIPSISMLIADVLFSLLVQALFLFQVCYRNLISFFYQIRLQIVLFLFSQWLLLLSLMQENYCAFYTLVCSTLYTPLNTNGSIKVMNYTKD